MFDKGDVHVAQPNAFPAKLAVYIRTKARNDPGAARQLESAKAYCRKHFGNSALQVYCDESDTEIPALERLVADATSGAIDMVLVDHLERFGRSKNALLTVMSRMEHSEVELVCTAEEDVHPEALPSFDQLRREVHARRSQLGKQEARKRREMTGGGDV